ncbi:BatD family protein [Rhizobium tumorigenes]|uniref:BatD family protein n=1 Tax=Rhizobium tumorigenes TaxID=2041385 RepID=A0AAF1K865_9HYPH|nr:BatD family protein [Rhizobium tumorigenes]WFR97580.1 BatD family protein [Rhizobium tumorigenes]WFS03182.1 BatD family protein [Rhizobium tumorigenes]
MKWLPIVLLMVTASHGFAAEPFARVEIEDKGHVVPGQQVRLDVTVFAPDFFTSPPQFPLFDLPNAVVTLPDERAENAVETVDGVQYSGIRRVYAIVPETSGHFSLPSVWIELGYSVDGKAVKGEASLPAFDFTVAAGELSGSTLTFAARNLTLTQGFDRDPASLKVGDALVRTITVFAEDTQAMLIPAVDVGEAAGVRQYAGTIRTDDNVSVDRRPGSRRIQTVTYTVEAAGSFVIPDVSYPWYDVDQHQQSKATLPSTKVTVVAAPSSAQTIAPVLQSGKDRPRVDHKHVPLVALIVLVALIAGGVVWRLRHRLLLQSARWIQNYRNSDRQALRHLRKTIRIGSAAEIEEGLRQWSSRNGYRSLTDWADGNSQLRHQVESLQGHLYGGVDSVIDREGLAKPILLPVHGKTPRRRERSNLPLLNPQGRAT